jgi:hypothetical protein
MSRSTKVPADERQMTIEGRTLLRGRKLSSLLEDFGGYEGEVTQPTTGRTFTVSLETWRGRNPDSTWLEIAFITDL